MRAGAWYGVLALSGLAFFLYVSQQPRYLDLQMNADLLLPVSLIWDLRHHDYAWLGFQLPRVPSLVPDLLLYAAADLATGSYRWALFIYGYLQFMGFVCVGGWLARLLTGAGPLSAMAAMQAVATILVLLNLMLPDGTSHAFGIFMPCLHFGPMLTALVGSALACRLLQRWRTGDAVLLLAASTAAVASDRLLIVAFIAPAILAAAVSFVVAGAAVRRVGAAIGVMLASLPLARLVDHAVNRQPDLAIDPWLALDRVHRFLRGSLAYAEGHATAVVASVAVPLVVFLLYPLIARASGTKGDQRAPLFGLGRRDAAEVFLWVNAGAAVAAVAAATALLLYENDGSYRYVAPVLTWPIIFTAAAALAGGRAERAGHAGRIALAASLPVFVVAIATGGSALPGPVTWRLPLADCLLGERDRLGLKAGLSEYWISRPLMIASGWSLQVNQVTGDGSPYVWGNDPFWFVRSFADPAHPPAYNFIVMKALDSAAIRARFGSPSRVETCPGEEEVWIYEDSDRLYHRLVAGTPLQADDGSD
jgi:hypothetical protein